MNKKAIVRYLEFKEREYCEDITGLYGVIINHLNKEYLVLEDIISGNPMSLYVDFKNNKIIIYMNDVKHCVKHCKDNELADFLDTSYEDIYEYLENIIIEDE